MGYYSRIPLVVDLNIRLYSAPSLVALRRQGLLGITRCRDLRRTHATICAEADLPTKTTQQRLGHKDPSITLKYYTHVTDRMKRQGATKLGEYKENRKLDAELDAGSRRLSDQ